MPISESLISTLGTFSKWGDGGDITATANGITSSSSNSFGKSSTQLAGDNTYVRIEADVKIGGYLSIGVTPGTWGSGMYGARFIIFGSTVSATCEMGIMGVGQYDRHTHGYANGTVVTAAFEYDNGTMKGYINGTLYSQYDIDLSSYSTWYPFIWSGTANTDFIQSMEEVVPSTSVTITPDALVATAVINDGTISTVRNISTLISVQSLTSSQPEFTVALPQNITVITTVQSLTASQLACTVYPPTTTTASNIIFMANRDKVAIKISSDGKIYWELD